MSEVYNISNAFKELDLLTEDTFKVNDDGIDKLRDFMDGDQVDEITIIDPEAETFDDVKESYIGKIILNCGVCQSKFYKDKEDIVIDEETQLANVGEECPYCTSADGFEIVGQVAEYCPDCHEDEDYDDMEDKEEDDEDEEEDEVEEKATLEESLTRNLLHTLCSKKIYFKDLDLIENSKVRSIVKEQCNHFLDSCKEQLEETQEFKQSFIDTNATLDHLYIRWFEDEPDWVDCYPHFDNKRLDESEAVEMAVEMAWNESEGGSGLVFNEDGVLLNGYDITSFTTDDNNKDIVEGIKQEKLYNLFGYSKDQWDDIAIKFNKSKPNLKENLSDDLAKYQKWVDYDMKKYGKVSNKTKQDLDKANLTIVKDKYGAYQVVSKEIDGKALKESRDLTKFDGTIAKLLADNMSKLSNITDVNELKSKIVDLLDSSAIKDKKAVVDFKTRIDKIKNISSLISTIATYITGMKSQPKDSKKAVKESVESVEVKTDTDKICVDTEGDSTKVEVKPRDDFEAEAEMITPVSDEVKDEIEAEQVSDEEVEDEDNFEDVDFDEFDEESFDELGEKYLKKVYENVKSYKTSSGSMKNDKLKLEGVITFNSGKQAKTTFLFEGASILKNGTLKLIGENKNFSDKKNAFGLRGKVSGNKLMVESFNYNYIGKDAVTGQSKKLYGTIRKTK